MANFVAPLQGFFSQTDIAQPVNNVYLGPATGSLANGNTASSNVSSFHDNGETFGWFIVEDFNEIIIGLVNKSSSYYEGVNANTNMPLLILKANTAGYVASASGTYVPGTTAPSINNVLDDGGGNATIQNDINIANLVNCYQINNITAGQGIPPIANPASTTLVPKLNVQYFNYSNRNFAFQNSLSTAYSTTSTTAVSTGAGITHSATTNVGGFMSGVVQISNNTLGDSVTASIYRSSSGIPTAGSAPGTSDTLVASYTITQEGLAGNYHIFSFMDFVSFSNHSADVSPSSTTYYWYLAIAASTGTASAQSLQMAAVAM